MFRDSRLATIVLCPGISTDLSNVLLILTVKCPKPNRGYFPSEHILVCDIDGLISFVREISCKPCRSFHNVCDFAISPDSNHKREIIFTRLIVCNNRYYLLLSIEQRIS